MYAFVHLHSPGAFVEVPMFVLMVLSWLRDRLRERRSRSCLLKSLPMGEAIRVDAKAEGDTISIGGWRPVVDEEGRPDTRRSPWFSLELTRETAPWAFIKGEPNRVVSALELLATLFGMLVLDPAPGGERGFVRKGAVILRLTSWTDSAVSASVVARHSTMSFPLCCINMELSAQLEARGAQLTLNWAPRTHNQEANDLTNNRFEQFGPALRVVRELSDVSWLVMPRLLELGEEFFKLRRVTGERAPAAGGGPRRKRLRETDPW